MSECECSANEKVFDHFHSRSRIKFINLLYITSICINCFHGNCVKSCEKIAHFFEWHREKTRLSMNLHKGLMVFEGLLAWLLWIVSKLLIAERISSEEQFYHWFIDSWTVNHIANEPMFIVTHVFFCFCFASLCYSP